jgi:hypothetical protein
VGGGRDHETTGTGAGLMLVAILSTRIPLAERDDVVARAVDGGVAPVAAGEIRFSGWRTVTFSLAALTSAAVRPGGPGGWQVGFSVFLALVGAGSRRDVRRVGRVRVTPDGVFAARAFGGRFVPWSDVTAVTERRGVVRHGRFPELSI